jgi:hypothetical protein
MQDPVDPPVILASQANRQWLDGLYPDTISPDVFIGDPAQLTPFLIKDDGEDSATIPEEPRDIESFMRTMGLKCKTTVYS